MPGGGATGAPAPGVPLAGVGSGCWLGRCFFLIRGWLQSIDDVLPRNEYLMGETRVLNCLLQFHSELSSDPQ